MSVWICSDGAPSCSPTALCEGCFGRELTAKRGQARAAGEVWAEKVARRPQHRHHDAWPDTPEARAIARRRILPLASDPRLADELATSCLAGAAAWWLRRPARYR